GVYKLDPVLQSNIDQFKFLVQKHIPDCPKEIEANLEVNHIWTLLKSITLQNTKPSSDSIEVSATPLSLGNGSMTHPLKNGSETHSETLPKVVELPVQSVTAEVKQDSSPSPDAGIWSHAK